MKLELFIFCVFHSFMCCCSLEFDPVDNYLIDCGSYTNTSIDNRVFAADNGVESGFLTTPSSVFVAANEGSISDAFDSALYKTARVFTTLSHYEFPIKKRGRHWIRLRFFSFSHKDYDLSDARFSVTLENFTLIRNFQPQNGSMIKEYSMNVTSNSLVLSFIPSRNSFAFLNALEVVSIPDEIIPGSVQTIHLPGHYQNLQLEALETVIRANMGNLIVLPQNDTLWRYWVSDSSYLKHNNLVKFVSKIEAVNYTMGTSNPYTAPKSVYGTATKLDSEMDPNTQANITWNFDVDPGFNYLVRFHFCDIVSLSPKQLFFNVYINSWLVHSNLDLSSLTSNTLDSPVYVDTVLKVGVGDNRIVNVSVGPSSVGIPYPNGILNGLEIMKISNSLRSLDAFVEPSSKAKISVIVVVASAIGGFVALVLGLVIFAAFRRRRLARDGCSRTHDMEAKLGSKVGYFFSLVEIQEATSNFSETLVIGEGGFGKVYKGVLRGGKIVAVKRGNPISKMGVSEFRTEIEMLSQFRHRHLVTLIGFCDENAEMIIIYEFMEKGTLKNHLYGSDIPCLNWTQRLRICIESARGLHYLHTGSSKAIIHRDVKSANILLDENFMAKVADFGISKMGPEIDETHVSTAVKGSFGYLDPEYLCTQKLTEKSDVYSFGIVMLEVLHGRPVIDPSLSREMVNLVEWAMKFHKKGKFEEIVDSRILGEIKLDSLWKFGEIIEKCLAEHGVDRPTMGDVLWNLEYSLQLQSDEERTSPSDTGNLETGASTIEFSITGVRDLAGVSMNRVFSQMLKAEV